MKRKGGSDHDQPPTQDPRGGSRRRQSQIQNNGSAIVEKQKRAPRQDPVSCQTCRTRKLKCNRQNPCSNCVSRCVDCVYSSGGAAATAAAGNSNNNSGNNNNNIARIDVVENVSPATGGQSLITHRAYEAGMVERQPQTQTQTPPQPKIVRPETSIASLSAREQSQLEERYSTVDRLEKIVMGPKTAKDDFGSSFPSGQFTASYLQNMGTGSYGNQSWSQASALTSCLPRESEAIAMFEYYINNVDHIYHLIIHSHVRHMIDDIYANLHNHAHVNLHHLALLFSILALTSYFRPSSEGDPKCFGIPDQAETRTHEYTSMVGAALTQADYLVYPTLEALQATVIIAHFLPTINTSSSIRAFFMHATIVSQARQLLMHCIDSPHCEEERRAVGSSDLVNLEVRRRVWWQIVGYDW
jgi:hypothetical protein